jgi:hypothetical protein
MSMKIRQDSVQWGGPKSDWYYFYWWNWLSPKYRYFGYGQEWYDGPIYHFGFWFFNWSWHFPLWDKLFHKATN